MTNKDGLRNFCDEAACRQRLLRPSPDAPGFAAQLAERYRLESYIIPFVAFENSSDLEALEIELGVDDERFALSRARLRGIDITMRAVEITVRRLNMQSLRSH